MTNDEAKLNAFLVEVFNDILRLEQASITQSGHTNLSVSELHVLEVIDRLCAQGKAGMAEVAAALSVTAGTLTSAVKTLEQKGYVRRERGEHDKRRVHLILAGDSQSALAAHTAFHEKLVANAAHSLSTQEMQALTQALASLHRFFNEL
ncbi:MAG: MarR family transcriptional regulator [Oscillospiraceae bacterium]|nr:MarR family transcriptional regulator [Oscillospiraceae bacterium]